jgi:hypothetical protein
MLLGRFLASGGGSNDRRFVAGGGLRGCRTSGDDEE